jgi:hypothetical protein
MSHALKPDSDGESPVACCNFATQGRETQSYGCGIRHGNFAARVIDGSVL